jgi:hypothetical protein
MPWRNSNARKELSGHLAISWLVGWKSPPCLTTFGPLLWRDRCGATGPWRTKNIHPKRFTAAHRYFKVVFNSVSPCQTTGEQLRYKMSMSDNKKPRLVWRGAIILRDPMQPACEYPIHLYSVTEWLGALHNMPIHRRTSARTGSAILQISCAWSLQITGYCLFCQLLFLSQV